MLTYADVCWQGSFERQLILVPANSTLAALLAQIAREVSLGTQAGIDPEIELHFFDTDGEVLDLRSFFFLFFPLFFLAFLRQGAPLAGPQVFSFLFLFFWHFFDKALRSAVADACSLCTLTYADVC
jgi:hypothetical protein